MADEYVFTNNAESELAAEIGGGATSLTVTSGDGALFPSITAGGGEKFDILVTEGSISEYMVATVRSGDTITVTRTDSNSFNAGSSVRLVLTAAAMTAMMQKGVHRTVTADPNGDAAEYDGEEVYDSTNEVWWKHLTGTVWGEINT